MRTEEILDQITDLTEKWYSLISGDHHKDRDCHFYINTVWSYGQKQKYRVEHYGYVFNHIEEEFTTYREAAEYSLETLKKMIKTEKESQENLDD